MVLELRSISKKIGKTSIIESFSYTFTSGNVYLLLGDNGSGKTTLLKCISSLYALNKGCILFNGTTIETAKQLNAYRKQISLFITPARSLMPNLTVLQNIRFFLELNGIDYNNIKSDIIKILQDFRLTSHIHNQVYSLSKGMKQKVALIITFFKNSNIILLDEPYDGLDANAISVLQKLIKLNSSDKIIIITSPNQMDDLSTQIINLKDDFIDKAN